MKQLPAIACRQRGVVMIMYALMVTFILGFSGLVVDLGLVYDVNISEANDVEVVMTLTSMGCPLGPVITGEVRGALSGLMGIGDTSVKIVWSPPWSPDKMTEDARDELVGGAPRRTPVWAGRGARGGPARRRRWPPNRGRCGGSRRSCRSPA